MNFISSLLRGLETRRILRSSRRSSVVGTAFHPEWQVVYVTRLLHSKPHIVSRRDFVARYARQRFGGQKRSQERVNNIPFGSHGVLFQILTGSTKQLWI